MQILHRKAEKLSLPLNKGKIAFLVIICTFMFTFGVDKSYGELDFGADAVSRYIWRGWDFGDAAGIQPWMAYTMDGFEIGVWSSWAWLGSGANENDLYISYATDNFGVTLTDYYFPSGSVNGSYGFFNYDIKTGSHIIELLGSFSTGGLNTMASVNFWGDEDNSVYLEAGYEIYTTDDVTAGLVAGLGNGLYTLDQKFNIVQIGLTATKGRYFASYIINPDQEVSWLFFGVSF